MMEKKIIYDVIIIGAGPVGLKGGELCVNNNLSFLILEKNNFVGGQPVSLYPNKIITNIKDFEKISSIELINSQYSKLHKNHILLNSKITSIKKSKYLEIKMKNNKFYCKNIILCCGLGTFVPNKLEDEILLLKDKSLIHYIIDDINFYKDKNIVVFGGGDSAVEFCNIFSKISNNVSLVHRRDELRAEISLNKSIKQYLNKTIINIQDEYINIIDKKTNIKQKISFDYIIVMYGFTPNLNKFEWMKDIKFDKYKKIKVNKKEKYVTSVSNIYAAGDCCTYIKKRNLIQSGYNEISKIINKIILDIKK